MEERILRAKVSHRPRLKNWSRDEFATERASEFDALAEGLLIGSIDRVNCEDLTTSDFVTRLFSLSLSLYQIQLPI